MRIKYLVWLICLLPLLSCQKDVCKITRFDLAYGYNVYKNGQKEFYFSLWKIPPSPSSPIPLDVKDSMDKLKRLGYELIPPHPTYMNLVYSYADCGECEKLEQSKIAKYECKTVE